MLNYFPIGLVVGLVLAALPAAAQNGVGGAIDVEEVEPVRDRGTYTYAAKFVCGTMAADTENPPLNPQLPDPDRTFTFVPGAYLSGINVLNPNDKRVEVVKFVTATPPERLLDELTEFLGPGREVAEKLEPFHGFEVDCRDIVEGNPAIGIPPLFDVAPAPPIVLDADFVSGFVILRSKERLKVVGVYSYKTVEPAP